MTDLNICFRRQLPCFSGLTCQDSYFPIFLSKHRLPCPNIRTLFTNPTEYSNYAPSIVPWVRKKKGRNCLKPYFQHCWLSSCNSWTGQFAGNGRQKRKHITFESLKGSLTPMVKQILSMHYSQLTIVILFSSFPILLAKALCWHDSFSLQELWVNWCCPRSHVKLTYPVAFQLSIETVA